MKPDPTPEEISAMIDAVKPLAAAALAHARAGNRDAAVSIVATIAESHDGLGLTFAAQAWIDSLILRTIPSQDWGHTVPAWHQPGGGITRLASDVDPMFQWVGQVISTRINNDREMYGALMHAIPDGQVGQYVVALLLCVAEAMNLAELVGRHGTGAAVSGHCPMGCGETLFLGVGGHITCSRLDCPRPSAVDELIDDGEPEHLVEFGQDTFTIRHPLHERLDNALMNCALHDYTLALNGPPLLPGTYRARRAGDDWTWEPLTSKESTNG